MERSEQVSQDKDILDITEEPQTPKRQSGPLVHSEVAGPVFAVHSGAADTGAAKISTPPSLCGKYEFVRELGRGGQARVYLANRLKDNRTVTVKQLNIDSVKAWKEYELFNREAEVLSRLNIKGVARFYEAIECLEYRPACSYIVQEYIEGASLAEMLKEGHRFSTGEVYDILLQMLEILKQLQDREPPVIHRDIKPSNIMISPVNNGGYKVTLIDFGAVANPQVQSGGSTVAGTYGYMPPEQLMGRPLPASDIYSLGAVAVELFSGISPAQIQVKDFRLIFEPHVQQLPVAVVNTLRRMLEPKAEERLSNLTDLITIFTNYKNENYESIALTSVKVDKRKQLNKQLMAVDSIGTPGNLELWQQLSDELPRSIPESMMDFAEKFVVVKSQGQRFAEWVEKHPMMALYLAVMVLIVLGILIANGWAGIVIALEVLFALIPFHSAAIVGYITSGPQKIETDNKPEVQKKSLLSDLLVNGRKTVATIVDIRYLPVPGERDFGIRRGLYTTRARPSFLVKYSFNPPDDERAEDLVHEYISHSAPENVYSKGDPLPILYKIEQTYFGEQVVSMPYPFPMEIQSVDELVFGTNAYKYLENVTENYGFRQYILPVLKARTRESILKELSESMWLLGDIETFRCAWDICENKVLKTDDIELRCAFISAVIKICHYANKETNKEARNRLERYLSGGFEGLKPTFEELEHARSYMYTEFRTFRPKYSSFEEMREKLQISEQKCATLVWDGQLTKYVDLGGTSVRDFNAYVGSYLESLMLGFAARSKAVGYCAVDDLSALGFAKLVLSNMSHLNFQPGGEWRKYAESVSSVMGRLLFERFPDCADKFAELDTKVCQAKSNDNAQYELQKYLQPLQSYYSDNDRLGLLSFMENKLWFVNNGWAARCIIQYGKESIWTTDDAELRWGFLKALTRIASHADDLGTKQYLQSFIACYLSNQLRGITPMIEEYHNLFYVQFYLLDPFSFWPSGALGIRELLVAYREP